MDFDSAISKSTLDSGLRVITERMEHVHSVSIGLWILAGTIDEAAEQNGIAHFLEHMVFKGTHSKSTLELADALESLGGHLNAFTSKEHTCYYAHVLSEHVETAVDVLADMMLNSRMAESDIEMEKDVILEEISEQDDSPGDLVHEYFVQSLFPGHPLGFSILGSKETVGGINRGQLFDFLHNNYSANRIVISAAGDLQHDGIVELVEKHFAALPARSERKHVALAAEVPAKQVHENRFQQAHLCIGRRALTYSDPKRYPLLVLNTILGAGMSSRLFQNIREKHGLAYSIYSFIDFLQHSGLFGIYLGTDQERLDFAHALVLKELETLKTEPVPAEELARRKNQLKGNLILGLEGTSSRMDRLAKMEIYRGSVIPITQTIAAIDAIDQVQILELAGQLFQPDSLHATILKPESAPRGVAKKAV